MKKQFLSTTLFIFISFTPTILSLSSHLSPTNLAVKQITTILNNHQHLHVGCKIYSLKNQTSLYTKHADHLFIPASNTKLFTAVLALELLGANYTFESYLATDGTLEKSQLIGDLYIKGSGDPSLKSSDLENALKHLSLQGIKTITGNIYIDMHDFDQEYFAPGSLIDNLGESWNSPVSACIVDRKPLGLLSTQTVSFMDATCLQNMVFDASTFFKTILDTYNITFSGQIQFKKCPESHTRLYTHYSAPLSVLIATMLKKSDNLYADCLFKKCGAVQYGYPGTWSKGTAALHDFVHNNLLLDPYSFLAKDGSGRSRYNLMSPHSIIRLLQWVYKQPYFIDFANHLSIAGIDGTLQNRMLPLSPHVKAKTGTLAGVSSLSGYIETSDDILAFSIITNGYISDSIANPPCKSHIEDAICCALATVYN